MLILLNVTKRVAPEAIVPVFTVAVKVAVREPEILTVTVTGVSAKLMRLPAKFVISTCSSVLADVQPLGKGDTNAVTAKSWVNGAYSSAPISVCEPRN